MLEFVFNQQCHVCVFQQCSLKKKRKSWFSFNSISSKDRICCASMWSSCSCKNWTFEIEFFTSLFCCLRDLWTRQQLSRSTRSSHWSRDCMRAELTPSAGYYSTQGSGSNTPATQLIILLNFTLLKEAITLLITLLRNSLLYSRSSGSNHNF